MVTYLLKKYTRLLSVCAVSLVLVFFLFASIYLLFMLFTKYLAI